MGPWDKRCVCGCLLLLTLSNCQNQDPPPQGNEMTSEPLTYLALGDSYTIGERVDSSLRWPVQLVKRLRDEGSSVDDPLIIARTGWTTDELDEGIDEVGPEAPFDLVTLLIGVNNQYRGRSLEEYRAQFRGLLERAVGYAGGHPERVVVLSIPDWGVTPFAEDREGRAIAGEIDAFNAANQAESVARGVSYVDVTGISREADPDRKLVASDGLHPSGEQYRRWVEVVLPVVREVLRSPGR